MVFRVERADWRRDGEALRWVRTEVFVHEQKVPLDLELDGRDLSSVHVIARDAHGAPIGTGRLLPDGHIGRIAVLRSHRGTGVGTALVEELVRCAREHGHRRVELDSQVHAIPFYERLGFRAFGGEFLDAGIPHRRMDRAL